MSVKLKYLFCITYITTIIGDGISHGISFPPYIMKLIIFNDVQNFNGSLDFINSRFRKQEKRFWDYRKWIPFLIEKVKSIDTLNNPKLELVKTYFYDGRYNSNLISSLKWNCNNKISELNNLIEREKNLLNIISQEKLSKILRKKINYHVESIKKELEEKRKDYFHYMAKQERNFEGQKELFENLKNHSFIELRTTPLKQREAEVRQKGVDVLLATDLVHLAHTEAYDIAVVLSGDTDLVEAVKLVKNLGKTIIIISYHTPGNPKLSNISDLMNAGRFINLKDFTNVEIEQMSELRSKKK